MPVTEYSAQNNKKVLTKNIFNDKIPSNITKCVDEIMVLSVVLSENRWLVKTDTQGRISLISEQGH